MNSTMIPTELQKLALEMAVDGAWNVIESCSLSELDGMVEWMNVEDEYAGSAIDDAFKLLVGLGLAEVHPQHSTWIREIANL